MKKVLVRYCPIWDGYDEAAQSVSAELDKPTDWRSGVFDVTIEEGARGEFTISYGDNIIFDKSKTDRFPKKKEIIKLISGE